MQYILNENEYNEFISMREKNLRLSHELAVANSVRQRDREQIKNQAHLISLKNRELLAYEAEIAKLSSILREAKRDLEGTVIGYQDKIKSLETTIKALSGLVHELSNPE